MLARKVIEAAGFDKYSRMSRQTQQCPRVGAVYAVFRSWVTQMIEHDRNFGKTRGQAANRRRMLGVAQQADDHVQTRGGLPQRMRRRMAEDRAFRGNPWPQPQPAAPLGCPMFETLLGPQQARIDDTNGRKTIWLGACASRHVGVVFAAEDRLDQDRPLDMMRSQGTNGRLNWHVGLWRDDRVDARRFALGRSPDVDMRIDD